MMTNKLRKDFLWGTATASYQIEGAAYEDGKGKNIWDDFSHTPGKIKNNDTGDVACDFYHKYKEDILLMSTLGVNSFRFSLSWPRIIPSGLKDSAVNQKGIEFYNNVINELLKHNIKPLITLYHWDLPSELQKTGGFLSSDFAEHFTYFSEVVFKAFGDRVKDWITFNEPWCICALGFCLGVHAPGKRDNPGVDPYIAAHNLLLAHAHSYNLYNTKFKASQKGVIGITLNADWNEPVLFKGDEKKHEYHKSQAERGMEFTLGWFADPIFLTGDYPEVMKKVFQSRDELKSVAFTDEEKKLLKGSSDFFGLNHYSTHFVYEPKGIFESVWIKLKGAYLLLKMLFTEIPSNKERLSLLWTTLFKTSYLSDIGVSHYPSFHVNETDDSLEDYEKIDYGITHMSWKVVPFGFRKLLEYIQKRYNPKGGIIVTENGLANEEDTVEDALDPKVSEKRISFFETYLKSMFKAMKNGVDVRGYFAWSFLDNYEWAFGYEKRFGMVYVDYQTQKRTPKPIFNWYKELIKTGVIPSR